jgi:hypothetical protein
MSEIAICNLISLLFLCVVSASSAIALSFVVVLYSLVTLPFFSVSHLRDRSTERDDVISRHPLLSFPLRFRYL